MWKVKHGLLGILMVFFVSHVDSRPHDCPDGVEKLKNVLVTTSIRLASRLYKAIPESTLASSALANLEAVAVLSLYSEGSSSKELLTALNLTKAEVQCTFRTLNEQAFDQPPSNTFIPAAAFFINDQFTPKPAFVRGAMAFAINVTTVNFDDADAAADEINEYEATRTQGNIDYVVPSDGISSETQILYSAGLYFKSPLVATKSSVMSSTFRVSSCKNVTTRFNKQMLQANYTYSSDLNAQALNLYYEGGLFSAFLVQPCCLCGLEELLTRLEDPEVFYGLFNSLEERNLLVSAPILNTSTSLEATKTLQLDNGITEVFDEETASLTALEGTEEVALSAIYQRFSIIDFYDDGEAQSTGPDLEDTIPVILNKPHLFFLMLGDAVLGLTTVADPSNQFNLLVDY